MIARLGAVTLTLLLGLALTAAPASASDDTGAGLITGVTVPK